MKFPIGARLGNQSFLPHLHRWGREGENQKCDDFTELGREKPVITGIT